VTGEFLRQVPGRRHSMADIPWLLSSPMGRAGLRMSILYSFRLVLMPLAAWHRKIILRHTFITAVVGSFGKTTTTMALRAALTPTSGPHPEHSTDCYIALDLLRKFSRRDQIIYTAAIDRPGRMAGFASMIRPQEVVVTSIGSAHSQSFGDLETTRDEKAWMVRALEPCGLAIFNADDPHVMRMTAQTQARIITFGFDKSADVRCLVFEAIDQYTSHMEVLIDHKIIELNVQLIGAVMAYSVLAVLAVARARELPLKPIVHALEALAPKPGRLQPVQLASGITLICDEHKSSLEMMEKALECLNGMPAKRRLAVLGEIQQVMGDEGDAYRQLGALAGKSANRILFLGKNSALEFLRAGFTAGGRNPSDISSLPANITDATRLLESTMREGDIILFKGRNSHWLQRVILSLMGKSVKCKLQPCDFLIRCSNCPCLEKHTP
jgi:UDP-N-acetylmuramyl pentapeptide synthase